MGTACYSNRAFHGVLQAFRHLNLNSVALCLFKDIEIPWVGPVCFIGASLTLHSAAFLGAYINHGIHSFYLCIAWARFSHVNYGRGSDMHSWERDFLIEDGGIGLYGLR